MGSISDTLVGELIRALQENTKVENKALNNIKNAAIKDVVHRGIAAKNSLKSLPGRTAGGTARLVAMGIGGVASGVGGIASGVARGAANVAGAAGRVGMSGARAGISLAAGSTDPRDVTGVGSSQALNSILDSIAGQAAGGAIRNLAGVTNMQRVQSDIQGGLAARIKFNAESGFGTSNAEADQVFEQLKEVATIKNREEARIREYFDQQGKLQEFDSLAQAGKALQKFKDGLKAATRLLELYANGK